MKPTIEEIRFWLEAAKQAAPNELRLSIVTALSAALDVAEADVAGYEAKTPQLAIVAEGAHHRAVEAFRATIAPSPGATLDALAASFMNVDQCRACGKPLDPRNTKVADGCPCNSPRGINHGLVPVLTCTCVECDPSQTGRHPTPSAGGTSGPGGER